VLAKPIRGGDWIESDECSYGAARELNREMDGQPRKMMLKAQLRTGERNA